MRSSSICRIIAITALVISSARPTVNSLSHIPSLGPWISSSDHRDIAIVLNELFSSAFAPHQNITDLLMRKCPSSHSSLKIVLFDDEQWLSHLPHFSQHFFFSLSVSLWLPLMNPFNIRSLCPEARVVYGINDTLFWTQFDVLSSSSNYSSVNYKPHHNLSVALNVSTSSLSTSTYPSHSSQSMKWIHGLVREVDRLSSSFSLCRLLSPPPPPLIENPFQSLCRSDSPEEVQLLLHMRGRKWFLHSADAVSLTSLIERNINSEIDRRSGRERDRDNDLDNERDREEVLHVLVVDRHGSRRIGNLRSVVSFMERDDSLKNASVSVPYLESLSFSDQLSLFSLSDVVLSVHGAAVTNAAFLPPCSLLLEVFPAHYTPAHYFVSLSRSVSLCHETWETETERPPAVFSEAGVPRRCEGVLREIWERERKGERAKMKGETEGCARCVAEIDVSLSQLERHLRRGLRCRRECIRTHPYYSPSHDVA